MFEIESYIRDFQNYPTPASKVKWGEVAETMAVHCSGAKPKHLIETRRPYEEEAIKNYRLSVYEPITGDIFQRALDNLQRIMSNSQVTVITDEQTQAYLDEVRYMGYNFMQFINKRVIRRMIEDPNGVLLWWPTGEGVENGAVRVEPQPLLVSSKRIHHFTQDVFTFLSEEKSRIKVNNSWRYEGDVYYVVTQEGYYKYSQYGAKSKRQFERVDVYMHNLGRLPLVVLGGETEISEKQGKEVIYEKSYFWPAVAYANEAIRQFSDHQGVLVTSAFPIREMEEQPCTECSGTGRVKAEKGRDVCGTCHGNGYVLPMSPYGILTRKKTGLEEEKSTPIMRYISPDVEILKYSGAVWSDLVKKAEKALNLLFIDEAQSGIAKEIDREDKVATLDKIGANIYNNIVKNSIIIIGNLRNISGGTVAEITLPSTFTTKTEADLIDELTTLKEKKVGGFLIAQATRDYYRKKYSGDRMMMRAMNFITVYDPLFYLDQLEKYTMLANATITEEQYARSTYAASAVMAVASEMGEDFLNVEYSDLKTRVDAIVTQYME